MTTRAKEILDKVPEAHMTKREREIATAKIYAMAEISRSAYQIRQFSLQVADIRKELVDPKVTGKALATLDLKSESKKVEDLMKALEKELLNLSDAAKKASDKEAKKRGL